VSDTRLLMHAERRIGKHDCSAGTDLLKAHVSPVEASVEVDEAVGAVREIADFAHDEDLAQAIIDRVLERGRLPRARRSPASVVSRQGIARSFRL
jgi:hypothetical protein